VPTLYILGGANGVGKTTSYSYLIQQGKIDSSLPFVNSDVIQKELGAFSAQNSIIAEEIVRNRMKELISEKRDFMIESNLAKASDYDWINLMRNEGYKTVLHFLGTKDVDINKRRVAQRVMEGGHGVSEPIIEQRYRMGLSYLKREILSFDEAYLVDADRYPHKGMATLQNGKVMFKEQNAPKWVSEVLFLAERLQEKLQQSSSEQRQDQFPSPNHDLAQRRSDQDRDQGFSL
jgi:predicted ABC-type ATPase